ncbi:MAG: heavy-metal-associated domain-containing protein [Deltaproteobacteria bacterium]|nr:heavy-metal-associated domain-containing protein [Deltaproteobacteria bacterium]
MRALLIGLVLVTGCKKDEPAPKPTVRHELAHMADRAPRPRPAQLTQVTIKALGMYCEESCPLKVRNALASIPAVYELGFDISNEAIFVSYDATLGPPKEVTKPMIVAIKSAGFDPWLAKESWPDSAQKVVQVVR